MIRKIILENFMAHARTELELAAGLTVIVGPNNGGKSAIVAGLDALANNESGDWMVRHGMKECRVTVITEPDGQDPHDTQSHTLVWQRKKQVSYLLDGQEFSRLNRKPPPELSPLLRLDPVAIDGDEIPVHIASQKQPVFLLDLTPGKLAAFFAASSDTALLIAMQKRFRERVRKAKERHLELQKRELALEAQLAPLAQLPALGQALKNLEGQQTRLVQEQQRLQLLTQVINRLRTAQGRRHRLDAQRQALLQLQPPPRLHDVAPGLKLLHQLRKAQGLAQRFRRQATVLARLQAPPKVHATDTLRELVARLRHQGSRAQGLSRRFKVLGRLAAPPSLHAVAPLQQTAAHLRQRSTDAERLHAKISSLDVELQRLATAWSAQATESWLGQLRPPRPADPGLIPVVIEELERRAEAAHRDDPFLAVFIWGQLLLHYADHLAGTATWAELPAKLRDALDAAALRLAQAEEEA